MFQTKWRVFQTSAFISDSSGTRAHNHLIRKQKLKSFSQISQTFCIQKGIYQRLVEYDQKQLSTAHSTQNMSCSQFYIEQLFWKTEQA